jgi:antitoxin component of RelBE/YafQ-DinJ toxin-antitoxin module
MSDRLTIRIDYDTKAKLNQIALRKGLTLSESIRELINREVGSDPVSRELEALKKLLLPLATVDLNQVLYHLARASVAPVAAAQLQNRETGDRLNDTVKGAAEKIAARMLAGNGTGMN